MRILFIRHGRTASNVGHRLDTGFPGAELDEVGRAQAADLAVRLRDEPIDIVMTSDILRARQTGEPLAKALGVPVITHPGVREIYAGDWEMDTNWRDYFRVIQSWKTDPTAQIPNGENGVGFFRRFDEAISELEDDDYAAVVSHGGALRTWLAARGDLDLPDDVVLGNTDCVVVEGRPGAWRILSWAGIDCHSNGLSRHPAVGRISALTSCDSRTVPMAQGQCDTGTVLLSQNQDRTA